MIRGCRRYIRMMRSAVAVLALWQIPADRVVPAENSSPMIPAATAPQEATLASGPVEGQAVQSFYVRAVTGPHRNRSVCYVCRYGARPVVMVLIQRPDPALPQLLKAIDETVDAARVSGLRSFGVLITDESARAVPVLQTMAFDARIQMPLTAATSVAAGTGGASLHPDAATTVVLYRDQKTVQSSGYELGTLDETRIAEVQSDIRRLLLNEMSEPR